MKHSQPIFHHFQILEPGSSQQQSRTRLLLIALLVFFLIIFLVSLGLLLALQSSEIQPFKLQIEIQNSTDPEILSRRKFIRSMAVEAWSAYRKYAYSYARNALKPNWDRDLAQARSPIQLDRLPPENDWWRGQTIVVASTTFWLMGLETQYNETASWIAQESFSSVPFNESTMFHKRDQFETIYLSSLLSAHALTGTGTYLARAVEIADMLAPLYDQTASGQFQDLDPSPLLLAYRYLVNLTGKYEDRLKLFQRLTSVQPKVNQERRLKWCHPNLAPFYTYQVQSYLQTRGQDQQSLKQFLESLKLAESSGLIGHSHPNRLTYIRYYGNSSTGSSMNTADCRFAAAFGLAGRILEQSDPKAATKFWSLAEALVETCHQAAIRSASSLPPERFFFNDKEEAENTQERLLGLGKKFALSADLPETYFILYRLTHLTKYRNYAWELAQAIHSHCRCGDHAYCSLSDVNDLAQSPYRLVDYQPATFLGSTLKYLYLIFASDELGRLDEWIWSEEGQAFPML